MMLKTAVPISKKLFDIYLLFTREPFVRYFTRELEYYSNGNGGLLGFISLDITDMDYSAVVLSRDTAKQYRATKIKVSMDTIEEARKWIDMMMGDDSITFHDNKSQFFDLFGERADTSTQHPSFILVRDYAGFEAAKTTLSEVSYHYKDIDGNFIEQFQSVNGFDARVWELFLFCFFREQFFSFQRTKSSPDFIIEKLGFKCAVEAVVVSRKTPLSVHALPQSIEEMDRRLKEDIPLMFGSALFDKVKKKYWEKPHVAGLPFIIAIADFHDTMSMTWTFSALLEYLYGYTYTARFDDEGNMFADKHKVKEYTKPSGASIPSGFFFQPGHEHISAILFSSTGTVSKFNRMGKQAGIGNAKINLIRSGNFHDHSPNAATPRFVRYEVSEDSEETWSEGVIIYHNPNARVQLDLEAFDERVAQCNFIDGKLLSIMPEIFPYSSITENLVAKDKS